MQYLSHETEWCSIFMLAIRPITHCVHCLVRVQPEKHSLKVPIILKTFMVFDQTEKLQLTENLRGAQRILDIRRDADMIFSLAQCVFTSFCTQYSLLRLRFSHVKCHVRYHLCMSKLRADMLLVDGMNKGESLYTGIFILYVLSPANSQIQIYSMSCVCWFG